VLRSLAEAGIPAAKIGTITPKAEGVKIVRRGQVRDLPKFDRDEIAKVLERS
jgi:hypothetical protein